MSDFANLIDQTAADAIIAKASTDAEVANDILAEAVRILRVQKTASSARVRGACRRQWPETSLLGDKLIDACTKLHEMGVLEEVARNLKEAFGTVNPWSAAARLFPQQSKQGNLIVRQGLVAWLESFGLFNMETGTETPVTTSTMGTVRALDVVSIYLGQRDEPTKSQTAQALREFCTDDWTESVAEVTDRINSENDEYLTEVMDAEKAAELIDNLIEHVQTKYDDAVGLQEVEDAAVAAQALPGQVRDACKQHSKHLRLETITQLETKAGRVADFIASTVEL